MKITVFPDQNEKAGSNSAHGETREFSNLEELSELIHTFSWAPGVFKDNHRKNSNFISEDVIAFDIDGELSLVEAKKRLDILGINYLIGFTLSHQKDKKSGNKIIPPMDRYRMILPLNKSITTKEIHIHNWTSLFKIFPEVDRATKDTARYFFKCFNPPEALIREEGYNFEIEEALPSLPKAKMNFYDTLLKSGNAQDYYIIPRHSYEFLKEAHTGHPGAWNTKLQKASVELARGGFTDEEIFELFKAFSPEPLDSSDITTINSNIQFGKAKGVYLNCYYVDNKKNEPQETYLVLKANFEDKYHKILDKDGSTSHTIEVLKDNTVKVIDEEIVKKDIVKLAAEQMNKFFSASQAETAFANWAIHSDPFEDKIYPVAFKGENKYSYLTLDFEPTEGETPLFDEMMSRVTNREALMAFTWSLFEEKADRSQYVWLFGYGGEGKSTFTKFLDKLLGDAYDSSDSDEIGSNFYSYGLIGKRLITYEDSNSRTAIKSGKFKSFTGNDRVRVERKGMQASSAEIFCKFLFCSNNLPEPSKSTADRRRLIVCKIKKFEGKQQSAYVEKLWEERSAFLYKCKEVYYNIIGEEHGIIPCDYELVDSISDDAESNLNVLFDRYFELDEDSYVSAGDMQKILKGERISVGVFRDWLAREFEVEKKRVYGDSKMRYIGIKEKI